MIYHIKK